MIMDVSADYIESNNTCDIYQMLSVFCISIYLN